MYHQNASNNQIARTPFTELVRLETYLSNDGADCFYTGFSGKIEGGGIFITTYRVMEKFAPVEVSIHFPDDTTIRPRGIVEWIREARPEISDTPPGIGISFTELRPFEIELIENWLLSNPPVFLDNTEIQPVEPRKCTSTPDNIEVEYLPMNTGPGCDLNGESLFVNGLAKDVSHYLNERPMTYLRERIAQENLTLPANTEALILTVRVVSQPSNRRFQGAFETDDCDHRLFVATNTPSAIGTSLRLQLFCDSGVRIGCKGVVRWIRKFNPLVNQYAAPSGMGIVLEDLKYTTWDTINPKKSDVVFCETI